MNILHITAHLGDGAGKAISGLAILGNRSGEHIHRILLLDKPLKRNHIIRCERNGVEILGITEATEAVTRADVVVLSWWGSAVMDSFLADFPYVPCRLVLWSHKNGYFDPPLPDALYDACDALIATSAYTLENPKWRKKASLVYGFGDFDPALVPIRTDYSTVGDRFIIGYVGTPGYKRLPFDCMLYYKAVIEAIPNVRFIMAGETSDEFRRDIFSYGIGQYFDLPGWVSDVPRILSTFDVFGYLMRPDSFATTENSVIEAMAAGIPCVVSRHPIGKFLIEDRISGFLVGDPQEYGTAMAMLYKDCELRRKIGEAGRAHVVQYCDSGKNLSDFCVVCSRVMNMPKKYHCFEGGN